MDVLKLINILFIVTLMLSATGCSTTEHRKFGDGPKIREAQRVAARRAKLCYRSDWHHLWQIPIYATALAALGGMVASSEVGAVVGAASGVGLSYWKWEVSCGNDDE